MTATAALGGLWRQRRRRLVILAVCLVLAAGGALLVGSARVPTRHVAAILLQPVAPHLTAALAPDGFSAVHGQIIWDIRLPRILLTCLAGAALAAAGAAYQGMFRNPMADPYLLGISSGAALGAALAIFFNLRFTVGLWNALPAAAFSGSLLSTWAVYRLARGGRRKLGTPLAVTTLLLAGLAMAALLGAGVSFLVYLAGDRMPPILFWLMGSLDGAGWPQVGTLLMYTGPVLAVLLYFARDLNALLMGEESAHHLGVAVDRLYRILLVAATLLTAATVSVGGVIGFVGLIVPHGARFLLGSDHRALLPGAALGGALLLLAADTVARTVLAPAELPVGIVTALVGGPFFLYLLQRHGQP